MKLEDVREAYYTYSGKASEIVRQLGFAGIALIYIFKSDLKTDLGTRQVIPPELIRAGTCIFAALAFDLLQYTLGAIIWGSFNRVKEKQLISSEEFAAPPYFNWPTNVCFWLKIILMVFAYVFVIVPFLYSYFLSRPK